MLKYDLIRMLEPFDDDIEILIFKNGVTHPPSLFYQLDKDGYGKLIIHNFKPELPKLVELK